MLRVIDGLTIFEKNPSGFKTEKYAPEIKDMLLRYMRSIKPNSIAGYVDDCKIMKETRIECAGYEDGDYCWNEQDIYHIEKYDAAVKPEFIEHVKKKSA